METQKFKYIRRKIVPFGTGVALTAAAVLLFSNFFYKNRINPIQENRAPNQSSYLEKKVEYPEPNKQEEPAPLSRDYAELLNEYENILKQTTKLENDKTDLSSKLDDAKKQQSQAEQKYTKSLEDYKDFTKKYEALEKRLLDMSLQYSQLDKRFKNLFEEKENLELEKFGLLRRYQGLVESNEGETLPVNDFYSAWFEMIKKHPYITMVFLNGNLDEIDETQADFYGSVDNMASSEIKRTMSGEERNRFATILDVNGDGALDLVYDTEGIKGFDKIKEGQKDGSFGSAKTIPNDKYKEAFSREFFKAFNKEE